MNIITAVLYGIVQGLTEFLPISSSGHLSLLQNMFGTDIESSIAFTVLLHLGTLAAAIIAYHKDVWELIKGFFSLLKKLFTGHIKDGLTGGERVLVMLIIATLPLVVGAVLESKVEALSGMSWLIGIFLIFNGFMLWMSDKIAVGNRPLEKGNWRQALFVGLIQLIAVMPGISRSGSTITGGLFAGFSKKDAVRFSFLLSIPAILGANILKLPELIGEPSFSANALPYLCGVLAAALSGFAAIKLLQYISSAKKLSVFSVYCIAVGLAAIIYCVVA